MQASNLLKRDQVLFEDFKANFLSKFQKMEYGTAGFRTDHKFLDLVAFRSGVMVSILSRLHNTKVLGLMITASHNPINDNGIKISDFNGGMLRVSLEQELEKFVNEPDLNKAIADFLKTLENVEGGKKIEISTKSKEGMVFLGGDTRPSTERLVNLAKEGVELVGGRVKDFGQCTTPMLHFFVYYFNGKENEIHKKFSFDSPNEEIFNIYHSYFGEKFLNILDTLSEEKAKKLLETKLLVDCSNGIGGNMFEIFLNGLLKNKLNVELINKNDTSNLNYRCGAEFVQKEVQYPSNSVEAIKLLKAKNENVRCISFDGDADRIIFFLPDENLHKIRLLDGDKQLSFFAYFFKTTLEMLRQEHDELSKRNLIHHSFDFGSWTVGTAQTAYANGASIDFLQKNLKIKANICPSGVKNLHPVAHHYDIGVYYESNGHGTVLFNEVNLSNLESFIVMIEKDNEKLSPEVLDFINSAKQLALILRMSNQAVGDSMAILLCIEAVLAIIDFSSEDWEKIYTDYPSKTTKVQVKDRKKILVTWDHSKIVEPKELQDGIDEIVSHYKQGRAFGRPSGTEDVVRLYAEAANEKEALEISEKVTKLFMENKQIN